MIGEVNSILNQTGLTTPTGNSTGENTELLSGTNTFLDIFKQLNFFAENEKLTTNTVQTSATETSKNTLANVVTNVIRNPFSENPLTNPFDLLQDEITNLQNSLAEELTSTLMRSFFSATQPTETSEVSTEVPPSSDNLFEQISKVSFGADGVGIEDVFDTLNPLNHVPIVSDIYQQTSASKVNILPSLAGSYLLSGPTGLAYAAADIVTKQFTGDSIFGNIYDLGQSFFQGFSDNSKATETSNAIQTSNISSQLDTTNFIRSSNDQYK